MINKHVIIFLISVIISACAQMMLKKSAGIKADYSVFALGAKRFPSLAKKLGESNNPIVKLLRRNKKLLAEYLNPFTMFAYAIFITASLLTIISYKKVPLSAGPVIGATEYFFVAALSVAFLKEKLQLRKALGLVVIFIGLITYSLGDKIFEFLKGIVIFVGIVVYSTGDKIFEFIKGIV